MSKRKAVRFGDENGASRSTDYEEIEQICAEVLNEKKPRIALRESRFKVGNVSF